jgi:hypothetical protein
MTLLNISTVWLNTFVLQMFRQITAIFLLIAFAAQIFSKAAVVLDYYANTASYSKNCENKSKPILHCNGKCQMMKKLQEEEKKDQQNPERKVENKNEVASSKSFFANGLFKKPIITHSYTAYFNTSFPIGITADIFHPPSLA